MVYVSISARIIMDIEALNMAESVGNVSKHKRAPMVVRLPGGEGYRVQLVPVVSGQSIAHGYQAVLAEEASRRGLPVCPLCRQGVFVKHASKEIIERLGKYEGYAGVAGELLELANRTELDAAYAFERKVVESCVVEDVGGFLFTGKIPVKRTSRFYAGYMVPARAHVEATASDYLLHTRHDPAAKGEEAGQMIYYVETGSALYTLTVALDLDGIGVVSGEKEPVCLGDRAERLRAAVDALVRLLGGLEFGAKKARFLPNAEVESLVAVVVDPLRFNPLPGHRDTYIEETWRTLASLSGHFENLAWELHYYADPESPVKQPGSGEQVVGHSNHVEALASAAKKALELAESKKPCS